MEHAFVWCVCHWHCSRGGCNSSSLSLCSKETACVNNRIEVKSWGTQTLKKNPKVASKTPKSKNYATKSQTNFQNCVYDFGYLRRSLPKNTSVPDECFGCPKAMQCLFQMINPKILKSSTLTQSHKTVKSQILCNSVGKGDARMPVAKSISLC